MKRILSVLIAVLMLFITVPVSVMAAEGDFTIVTNPSGSTELDKITKNVEFKAGSTINVDFMVEKTGINNMGFWITYDPSVIKARNIVAGSGTVVTHFDADAEADAMINLSTDANTNINLTVTSTSEGYESIVPAGPGMPAKDTGKIKVGWIHPTGDATTSNGRIFTLRFDVIGTGSSTISVAGAGFSSPCVGLNSTVIPVNIVSGTVNVTEPVELVSGITVTGAGGATTITTDGGTLQMNAEVLPANATDKSVTWSVTAGTGQATIDQNGLLTAVKNGTVTVKATANDGSGISGTQEITISNQTIKVTAITVTGQNGASTIATDGGNLQMIANVQPADATNKTVTWSVENGTGSATIDASGLLTATGNGTVTVKATANDGSGIVGQTVITISGQLLPPSAGLTTPFFVLSAGNDTVTPKRAQNTTKYQAEVDYTVDKITVTPTAADGTIKVNGNVVATGAASGEINLNVGANPITITVQEDGKAAKTYTITVTRLAANANANLKGLTVDGNPVANFGSAVLTYNVKLSFGTTIVPTVVGETEDANATVQVTPATNLSGTEAERTTTVTVTAQDGTTKKTYKVIFEVAKQFTVTANKTTVGNRQHVTVNVANAGVATTATIILALYDTSTANVNDMKALIFKETSIAGGNNPGILTGGFIVPTNYTIKAFVWDDFNSQKALSDVAIP